MKDVKLGCKIIAILIILTLLLNLGTVLYPMKIYYDLGKYDQFATLLVIRSFIFLLLNAVAVYGLYCLRSWGYGVAYAAIVYSTLFFGVSYIPFFEMLFPAQYVTFANLLANIGILTLLISMQMMEFQPRAKKEKKRKKA
jgi:hypothetical protein